MRDDLHSSDDDNDDELLHDVFESDVECSVGMGYDHVPADSVIGCTTSMWSVLTSTLRMTVMLQWTMTYQRITGDSDATADYDLPADHR